MPIQKITKEFINKPLAKELLEKSQNIINTIQEKGSKKVETKQTTIPVTDTGVKQEVKKASVNVPTNDAKIKVSDEEAKNFIDKIYEVKNNGVKQTVLKDFNINNIDTKDDVLKIIDEISKKYSKEITARTRGVQTQKATQEAADILNLDQETFLSNILKLKPGSTANAETITAIRDLLVAGNSRLDNLATAAKQGGPNELLEFKQHMALMAEVQKIFKGIQTETARSLNSFKYKTRDQQFTNINLEQLNKVNLLTELGGEEQIRQLANLYSNSTVKEKLLLTEKGGLITKFGDISQKGSDSLAEVYINAILSNPFTHVKNTAGNWISQGITQFERTLASAGAKMGTEGVAPYEDVAKAFGKSQALHEMWQATVTAIKQGKLPNIVSEIGGNKLETRPGAITASNYGMQEGYLANAVDLAGKVVTLNRIPTRMLGITDNLFKNLEYRSELYAQAYRDTLTQIANGTLREDKAAEYLARTITNPSAELTKAAYDAAQYVTFQTKLGQRNDFLDAGKFILDLKSKTKDYVPGIDWLFNVAIPFVQTPANILGFTLERSPGLNLFLKKYREDLMAGGARADMAMAKMELGLMFYAVAGTTGYFGYTSGSDPDLARLGKGQKIATYGYQPKTIRIPYTDAQGNPKAYQVSVNGFDPAAQLFAMASDLGSLYRNVLEDKNGDYIKHLAAFALFAGENLTNTPFLQNTADLFDNVQAIQKALATGDPSSKEIQKMVNNTLSSLVPAGAKAIGNVYNNIVDEEAKYQKIAIDLGSYFKRSFDEQSLYAKYDLLGDPIDKYSMFSTLKVDPIRSELKYLDPKLDPFPQSKSINFGAFSVAVPFNERELSFLQKKSGELTKEKLGLLFQDPMYVNEQDDYVRKALVTKNISAARTEAEQYLFQDQEIAKSFEIRAGELANSKAMKENNGQPLNLVPSTLLQQQ